MRRRWNWPIWVGFVVVLAGLFSYQYFAQFPSTRDFPWANLLLLVIGLALVVLGLMRAYREPAIYRGKIFGPFLAAMSVCLVAIFAYAMLVILRQVPPSTGAPHVGDKAPAFTLPDKDGEQVALADLISQNGAVLIFYRGHW